MRKMLKALFAAAAVAAVPGTLPAQYALDMRLEHTSYLQFEGMEAHVVVRNDTDHLLLIGGLRETSAVDFDITRNKETVRRRSKGLLAENVLILPGQTREIVVDLGRHYDIQPLGEYRIAASFVVDGAKFISPPRFVDVVPGLILTSTLKAVPKHPSRMRRYTLRYWNRQDREMLFLCVADEKEGINYGVFMLGPMVRVVPPELSVDSSGNVLVKHQADNGTFAFTTLKSTFESVVLVRQQIKSSEMKLPGGRKSD